MNVGGVKLKSSLGPKPDLRRQGTAEWREAGSTAFGNVGKGTMTGKMSTRNARISAGAHKEVILKDCILWLWKT